MAAVLAGGLGAVLSHRSAGQLWRIVPPGTHWPEVTRPSTCAGLPGVVVHRGALPADELTEVRGIPATSVSRTLFDLAATLPERGVERAFHEAEVRRLTSRLSVPHLLARYPRHRGNSTLRTVLVAGTPEGITRNDFEERFVALLDAHGLPRPRFNATLALRGRFFEVDCLWQSGRLVGELDGREVHETPKAFQGDRERDRILLAEGWRVARVTWRQLRDEGPAVAADLRQALAQAARQPHLPDGRAATGSRTSYP